MMKISEENSYQKESRILPPAEGNYSAGKGKLPDPSGKLSGSPVQETEGIVSLTLSEQGKSLSAADGRLQAEMEKNDWNQFVQKEREASENGGKEARKMAKCFLIARRIASGDKVPDKDVRYLQENNQELYSMSMKIRIPKKDPKEYKSVLEGEEDENDRMMVPDGVLKAVSGSGTEADAMTAKE